MPDNLQRWEVLAARAGHIGLYVLLFGASLTGWALAGTFRRPMAQDLFGIPIPQLLSGPGPDRIYHNLFEEAHMILSYLLAALIVVHIAGSLRHHFIKRNDVMRRMWLGARPRHRRTPINRSVLLCTRSRKKPRLMIATSVRTRPSV